MSIETLPFEHRPRNSIANNLDKINELVDWTNLDTHLYASASGERVTVDVASNLKGLTVDGRSVQDGTPTPDAPVPVQVVQGANLLPVTTRTSTLNGVTARVNADGSISLSGTSTAEGDVYIYGGWQASSVDFDFIAGSYYTLSITPIVSGVTAKIYSFTSEGTLIGGSNTNPATGFITIRAAENAKRIGFSIRVASGVNVDGVTVRVQFEHGSEATPYVPYGSIGIVVGDTATPIDLHGNVLASLPDGTRDELHVDSAGHVWIEKRVKTVTFDGDEPWSKAVIAPYNMYIKSETANSGFSDIEIAESQYNPKGIVLLCDRFEFKGNYAEYKNQYGMTISGTSTSTNLCFDWRNITESMSLTEWKSWLAEHPVNIHYPLAIPQEIELGYITPPAIPSGSVVTVSASLTPRFTLEWWVDDGITALVDDLIAYVDYKTEG